ncbi:MAG: hypothetical protein CMN05_16555 [Roseibacillus sp.]|jgi:LysM repeat protein|nr:hypothetical protein [Roseibacillus sp.]MBP34939.1 hypothetical protein [Roseibacillus sp.]MCP4729552.1 LysM peptidoglycan-binding domain-containing protein [Roseibacillus sp.]MDP7306639.1 LysM peptidoglycan-binding domain-containing protein [Roseibacillus sp.]HJM65455.1 LysM peptidoglycan-binding domain-containing protein [Roseibacillus sp.]|tara:strand:- start:1867 stop:2940 length:1074 start_codon:yes stop_codon:yes gene_type:complete
MRILAFALSIFLGPASFLAEGRSELDILRARCGEQERQIRTLETDIENLHSQLALERRRARGADASATSAAHPKSVETCTVKTGDTLSSIARRYNTSVDTLMKTNEITDPTRLRIGQKLTLPEKASPSENTAIPKAIPIPEKVATNQIPPPRPTSRPAAKVPADAHNYTVERGDTLYGIARRHKISVSALRGLNPDIGDQIVVGQTITVTGKIATVRPPRNHPISTHKPKAQTPPPTAKSTPVRTAEPKKAPAPKTQPAPTAKKQTPAPKTKPTPTVKKQAPAPKPGPSVSLQKKETRQKVFMPKTISSVFVTEEVSFGDFAKRHGTTPEQLNALNGWNFRSSLVLAKGSEIYVPGR